MSTLLLMKLFEAKPHRYDKGIRMLTGGQLDDLYDCLIEYIKEGDRVLDIGCGTGALAPRAAGRGAAVKAIDINPGMLDIARLKAEDSHLSQNIRFIEMGVAELGNEPGRTYDVAMSGLCLSELTEEEQDYALNEVHRILKPGGLFLVTDETRPDGFFRRTFLGFFRLILKLFVFVVTGATTKPLKNFPDKLKKGGFEILSYDLNENQTLMSLSAKKSREPAG